MAIDATSLDLFAPAPFDSVIKPDQNGTARRKGSKQQAQQDLASSPTTPASTVQYSVVILKVLLTSQAHDAKDGADRSFTRSQNSSPPATVERSSRHVSQTTKRRSQSARRNWKTATAWQVL